MASISEKQLQRYPIYLKYLITLRDSGVQSISAPAIARALKLSDEQVKKDLQVITRHKGIPNKGRDINALIEDLEVFLGYHHPCNAILIGVGHLGSAFMNYEGFSEYGLNILMGFDVDKHLFYQKINGKMIYPLSELKEQVLKNKIKIAILTTPASVSQAVADLLVQAGIKAIWNFAPIHLDVGEQVVVENVNLASSLAVLLHRFNEKI